jgi:hypothetical protein
MRAAGLLLLTLPAAARAGEVSGTVVDPQHQLLVGARVSLACAGETRAATTDAAGAFRLEAPAPALGCVVAAEYPGLERVSRPVGEGTLVLTIELPLARVRESLLVESEPRLERGGLDSAFFTGDALRKISRDTAELVRHAREAAGSSFGPAAIYVDGQASTVLPPATAIESLAVNQDPLSVERADGKRTQVDITTRAPEPAVRFGLGAPSLFTAGGDSRLGRDTAPSSRAVTGSLSGPLPALPLTFSLSFALDERVERVPIEAVTLDGPFADETGDQPTANRAGTLAVSVHYSRPRALDVGVAFHEQRDQVSNAGIGGLTLPSAGWDESRIQRQGRVTLKRTTHGRVYRSGLLLTHAQASRSATSPETSLSVLGSFVGGGAPFAASHASHTIWTWNSVVESRGRRPLTLGLTLSGDARSTEWRPNPNGTLVFPDLAAYAAAQNGAPTGTWFGWRGEGLVSRQAIAVAPFAQKTILQSDAMTVVAGLRGDYQKDGGLQWSPRLSAVFRRPPFVWRASGGLFVHNLDNAVLLQAAERDVHHLTQLLAPNVSGPPQDGAASVPVTVRMSAPLDASSDWIFRVSGERTRGGLTAGLEYSWMGSSHRLGSRRVRELGEWTDWLESNRRQEQQEAHARLGYTAPNDEDGVVAHYTWTLAHDDGDGPFSYRSADDDGRADWARSAGLSPHAVSVVGHANLGGLAVSAVATWRSSAPYDVTSTADAAADGLYDDRAGRPRNSGRGASYSAISFYASRRVTLPWFGGKRQPVDVLVRVENVLDRTNVAAYGTVLDTPTFGRPLAALPGRSLQIGLHLGGP